LLREGCGGRGTGKVKPEEYKNEQKPGRFLEEFSSSQAKITG
jgi:hypothetical protein